MKNFAIIVVCVFAAVLAWKIGEAVHPTTLSMLVGVVFGALAGIPTGLIVLASTRRKESTDRAYPMQQPQAPPVIFFGGNDNHQLNPPQSTQPVLPYTVDSTTSKKGEIVHVDW